MQRLCQRLVRPVRPDQVVYAAHAAAQLRHAFAGSGRRRGHTAGHPRPSRACTPPPITCMSARSGCSKRPACSTCWPCPRRRQRAGHDRSARRSADAGSGRRDPARTAATSEARYGGLLSRTQRQALRDLARCRTAALGGHVEECLDCNRTRIAYNSCRNRHCPKCQAFTRARWLAAEAANLLPVEYFHVVFTLPAEVADLALANPAVMYDLLFHSLSDGTAGRGGWPQAAGRRRWASCWCCTPGARGPAASSARPARGHGRRPVVRRRRRRRRGCAAGCRAGPGFFLPVRVLSRVFRGKFLDGLHFGVPPRGKLGLPGRLAALAGPTAFASWLAPACRQEWVVYSKPPFGGPAQVLKYLARYTHRVALSNSRLVALEGGRVTFAYKDYADGRKHKTMTLSAVEFLRRFLQHVLPQGFAKVPYYGLLANRRREQRLQRCRRLLLASTATGGSAGETGSRCAGAMTVLVRWVREANASYAARGNRSLRLRRRRSRRRAIRRNASRPARAEQVWEAAAAPSRRRGCARRGVGPEKGTARRRREVAHAWCGAPATKGEKACVRVNAAPQ